jgi:hypothetical protein
VSELNQISLIYRTKRIDTTSCLPSNPWSVSPGEYARPDGSSVYVEGIEVFWNKEQESKKETSLEVCRDNQKSDNQDNNNNDQGDGNEGK